MAVYGGMKCIKYLMFAFNFLFWLAGTAVLAIGLWLRFDKRTEGLFADEGSPSVFFSVMVQQVAMEIGHAQRLFLYLRLGNGVYLLIVAGALMMVVGFLGCCGAIRESPCMLGLFFFFLLLIFAAEVAAGIWGLSNKDKVVDDIKKFYTETYTNYIQTKQEALKATLKAIQFGLDCCGISGTIIESALQDTCPKKEGLEAIITTSCPVAIEDMFNSKLHVIGGVGIGIGVIMIFGMIFSMLLCCAIKRTRDIV